MKLIFDINGESEFFEKVISAEADLVVIADFWAPWCGPCRMLGPVLEKVVQEMSGSAVLAKINVDENRDLSAKWQIKGIPAVKIFRNGNIVKEFAGALSEMEVRKLLSEIIPSEIDILLDEAATMFEGGDLVGAENICTSVLEEEPVNSVATLLMAKIALEKSDFEVAAQLASKIGPAEDGYAEAEIILARVMFAKKCAMAGDASDPHEKLNTESEDLDILMRKAYCLAGKGMYEESLNLFLAVLEKNTNKYGEEIKHAMVAIFSIVGQRSPLADDYRERLARLLYS